jgi:hypothetical protein
MMDGTAQRAWLEQWRGAVGALADQRRSELRAMSAEQAHAAAEAVLALASPDGISASRRRYSGLVEQQRLFHPQIAR